MSTPTNGAVSSYEPTATGVMDCLMDAVLHIADTPISDKRKVALIKTLIETVSSQLTIADLQQIAADGLRGLGGFSAPAITCDWSEWKGDD